MNHWHQETSCAQIDFQVYQIDSIENQKHSHSPTDGTDGKHIASFGFEINVPKQKKRLVNSYWLSRDIVFL